MTQTEFQHTIILLRPRLLRIAENFFHNMEDAEDIVQEVCLRMLQRGWHEGDNVEALAIRATKNLCVSVWRRQRLRSFDSLENIPESTATETADGELMQREGEQQIESALHQLSPSQQHLLHMKEDNDMSIQEISQETGITRRSVSAIISGAKKRLFNILKATPHDK